MFRPRINKCSKKGWYFMLKKLGLVLCLFVSPSLFAGQAEIDKVLKLANTVKTVAVTSDASDESFKQATEKLREVIDLLSEDAGSGGSNTGNDFVACYDFAYQKYYSTMNSAAAADKATVACKGGVELDVLKFLYEKHYASNNAATAMDLAVAGSSKKMRSKLDMIKFMYEKYYSSMNASQAATKASAGAQKAKKDGLPCLQKLYASYYQSQSAATAMDNAVNSCSAQ